MVVSAAPKFCVPIRAAFIVTSLKDCPRLLAGNAVVAPVFIKKLEDPPHVPERTAPPFILWS